MTIPYARAMTLVYVKDTIKKTDVPRSVPVDLFAGTFSLDPVWFYVKRVRFRRAEDCIWDHQNQ